MITTTDVINRIAAILRDRLQIDLPSSYPKCAILREDLDLDSLALLELSEILEYEFDVNVFDPVIKAPSTYTILNLAEYVVQSSLESTAEPRTTNR